MTPSQLKYEIESRNSDSHYFTRSSMKFFGDTMRNYGVRRVSVVSEFDSTGNYSAEGFTRDCWELYRKRPVKNGNCSSAYFDCETLSQVHCILKSA